jgi:hypothetical protein
LRSGDYRDESAGLEVAALPGLPHAAAQAVDDCRPVVIAADTAGSPPSGWDGGAALSAAPCPGPQAAAAPRVRDCGCPEGVSDVRAGRTPVSACPATTGQVDQCR